MGRAATRSSRRPASARSGSGRGAGWRGAARTPRPRGGRGSRPTLSAAARGCRRARPRARRAARTARPASRAARSGARRPHRAMLRAAGSRSTRRTPRPTGARPAPRAGPDGRATPVEEERSLRVRLELTPLPRCVVRVEDEPALVEALQQHHPHRRGTGRGRRRERHRLGHVQRFCGLGEPAAELLEWVGCEIGAPQLRLRLATQRRPPRRRASRGAPPGARSSPRARRRTGPAPERPAAPAPPRR